MATKTTRGMTACAKKHPKIFYVGKECPACRIRLAGLAIFTEYQKVHSICQALISRIVK